MQNYATCLVLAVSTAVFSGCADIPRETVLNTVGPAPAAVRSHATGYLIAYTPVKLPPMNSDTLYYPHSSYALFDSHGVFLRRVRNHLGPWDESPECVSLPPGRYTLRAQSDFPGDLIVPVIIRGGRTTTVDLAKDNRYSVTSLNPD
ncbi:MAG: hypothetical protein P4L99_15815 [Chthoniobacter sp.]|nr:hypothetical protein [Chthoniobacter sp.]